MNIKVKTALIIMVTLFIGMAAGALINRAVVRHKIQEAFAVHRPDKFVIFMERIIQAEPEQKEKIRAVLMKHAGRMKEMRHKFFTGMQDARESLLKDLKPILTSEQRERLKRKPPLFPPDIRHRRDRRSPLIEPPWKKPPPDEKE